jgi:hypothetical protein
LAHYFLRRAVHLCRAYLDYEDVLALQEPQTDPLGNHAWIPPQDQATRQSSFYLLLISLQLVLLVGLSFYCPWEVFVQAAEPDQLTELASHWTIRPIVLALRATPHSAALFCWCIATLLFIFLPPLVLLTLYLRCVVAIEPLRQMILQRQRSIQ